MDYREEILRTQNTNTEAVRQRLASDDGLRMLQAVVGLSGEAGEVSDIIKKWVFHGTPIDYGKLMNELGDVRYYLELALSVLNKTMGEVEYTNIVKLRTRYPEGFTEAAAAEKRDQQ